MESSIVSPPPAPTEAPAPVEEKPPVEPIVEPVSPTIVVDTEPSVRFSNVDTVFDASDPNKHTFRPTIMEDEEHIEFVDDSNPPEEISDFDTL
jgi:hypothetical protein